MGGFRSFFIESKLFQLVVEEGGNFFSLRIFERGKYFMQSILWVGMQHDGYCKAWNTRRLGLTPNSSSHSGKETLHT